MINKKELQERVFAVIDNKEGEIIQTLKELVAIPTQVGNERAGQKYIENLYSGLGLKVTALEVNYEKVRQHVAFVESGFTYAGRPNIIGILEGSPASKSLTLNGHIDVVSPEPIEAWSYSPWQGTVVGQRMYGRGAVDMKAGLVANYFALKCLLAAGLKPQGRLMLQSVIEEEAGGSGTLACLLGGYTADGLVISEPRPEITVAMTGVYYFRVKVMGRTAHAGLAHTGVNAIGKITKIYDALVTLDEKRAREKHNPVFEKKYPRSCHLNIGTLKAGDWPSTVAGWAEMECRLSIIPGERIEDVKNEVLEAIRTVVVRDEWLVEHLPEVTWFGWHAEPWQQDPDDPLVVTFKTCAEKVFGTTIETAGRTAGLDTRFASYFNMPALTFGPNGGNYHGVDEYVELGSLMKCIKVLALFIMEWCGIESS
jgi:acetylornithine deacetylase